MTGKQIRASREAHGWSIARLADKARVGRCHLGEIERGLHVPSESTIARIERALTSKGRSTEHTFNVDALVNGKANGKGDGLAHELQSAVAALQKAIPLVKRAERIAKQLATIEAALSR